VVLSVEATAVRPGEVAYDVLVVGAGEDPVEHHAVRRGPAQVGEPGGSGGLHVHLEALPAQEGRHEGGGGRVVFDEEHPGHGPG
jgi:hypothetical protein